MYKTKLSFKPITSAAYHATWCIM